MAWAWSRTSGACNGSGFSQAGWRFDADSKLSNKSGSTNTACLGCTEGRTQGHGATSTKAQHHYTSCSSPSCVVSATKPV